MADDDERLVRVDGHRFGLSNLDKVFFPDSGHTKGDVVEFYRRIADTALTYYRDRPLSMERFPDGINKEGFFQKSMPDYFPGWISHVTLKKEGGRITHVVANDTATLVYLADQGCITPHLALSRTDRIRHPDRLVFDLDPSGRDFAKVRRAALRVKDLLDDLGLVCFVQTTGSRGLHVVVPLDRSAGFDEVRDFAHQAARLLAGRFPDALTIEHRKQKRRGRVFLDYLRNAYGQTSVAPYALRARPGAPIATPLDWSEVTADLGPRKYTLDNIFRRLGAKDDPWAGMGRHARALAGPRRRLEALRREA